MEIQLKTSSPVTQRTACIIVGIFESRKLSESAKELDEASSKVISKILRRGDMDGKIGQSLLLHDIDGITADRVLLIGCGRERDLTAKKFRKIVAHSIQVLNRSGALDAFSTLSQLAVKDRDYTWCLTQAATIALDTLYSFNDYKSGEKPKQRELKKLTFTVATRRELAKGETAIAQGVAIANGMKLTRDLGNHPANVCHPSYLADTAKKLARGKRNLTVKVLDEAEMKKLGMNVLLSVSQGSAQPAKLITFEYKGGKKGAKPITLVGKGVTFDTGGISIKPSPAMDEMKYDMCGAATVFGCISAVAEMQLPINVVGVVASVENMPSDRATRPGDIYTSMSGQTVEVLNTDAEGRLILCDALTYCEKFNPDVVIDIATLTGACVIALGKHASGLLSNNDKLAEGLLEAGEESCDRAWQLPLWEEYDQQLASPFADMANIGGREAGTITAGCFLGRFAKDYRWAHIDIAGTAWVSGKNKSATGRPVPMLMQYIMNRC